MDGTCLWLWQRSLRSRGLGDTRFCIPSCPCHLPGEQTGVNASSSLDPLVLKWIRWGDIDGGKKAQGRLLPVRQTEYGHEAGNGHTHYIHRSWSYLHLIRHTFSFIYPFIPHRLIHWETALFFSATGSVKRQAWISASFPFSVTETG